MAGIRQRRLKPMDAPRIAEPGSAEETLDRLVELERLRLIHRHMPTSTVGTMVGVTLLLVVMWPHVDHGLLLGWFAAMAVNQGWRAWLYLRYRARGLDLVGLPSFIRQWTIGAGISSAIWCIAAIFFFVPGNPIYQTLLMVSIFAIMSVAVPLVAPHPPSFHLFVVPVLSSLILRNAWEGDAQHLILAFATTAMMIGIPAVGRRYFVMLNASLRVRFENEALAGRLAAQNSQLEAARAAAEEANQAKTRFFAAASHDLRQPLHAIGLFADLLASRLGKGENGRLAQNIHASVGMLESLFTELLNISRIDAGVIKPEPADFELHALLDRLCADFEAEAARKGLHLRLHAQEITVHSDPFLVERMLRNLIGNAIRYTEQGGILVGCRRRGQSAWVEVWDTGIGIPAEHRETVFEEFRQLNNPERNIDKGLGLGLSIVRRLADVLGLSLSLVSQPGRGTRFRFALPAVDAAASPAEETAGEALGGLGGRLVLLMEDEEELRRGMATLLENWGAEVIACPNLNAAAAATLGRPAPPDLIVGNYIQPDGQGGAEAVAVLREHFARPIPAIVLAGAITPERAEEARRLDFHLLLKPVPPAKLRALISAKLAGDAG